MRALSFDVNFFYITTELPRGGCRPPNADSLGIDWSLGDLRSGLRSYCGAGIEREGPLTGLGCGYELVRAGYDKRQ
jgi:hypothetical protein